VGSEIQSTRGQNPRSRACFTLIELLVVVAIIAVLIAMLLPSLAQARYKAKLLTDTNQLKSWGNYLTMYASDNRDFFPCHGKLGTWWWWPCGGDPSASEYGGYWSYAPPFVDLMYPKYIPAGLENMFFCPLDSWRSYTRQWPLTQQFYGFSYAYLGSYGTDPDPTRVTYAARCKTLSDPVSGLMADQECWTPQQGWIWNHAPDVAGGFGSLGIPSTVNILYTDSHVELTPVPSLWYPYNVAYVPQ